jgi:hypothetical protein
MVSLVLWLIVHIVEDVYVYDSVMNVIFLKILCELNLCPYKIQTHR